MTTTRSSSSATSRKSAFPCTVLGLKPNLWTSLNCLSIGMAHLSCRITGKGSVFYRREDVDTPLAEDALLRVEDIAARTMEYMTAMENALRSKPAGWRATTASLPTSTVPCWQEVIANTVFNSLHGIGTTNARGVTHGHYFMENYDGAKQDFVTRSGLIHKEQLFSPEQMTEIYRCCADSVDGEFFELTDKQEEVIRSVQQQIEVCVPDLNERIRQQEEALEQASQEQTM